MSRHLPLLLFVFSLTFTMTGCGRSGENKVITPTTTQTEEELAAIDEEREAAMDTSNLQE